MCTVTMVRIVIISSSQRFRVRVAPHGPNPDSVRLTHAQGWHTSQGCGWHCSVRASCWWGPPRARTPMFHRRARSTTTSKQRQRRGRTPPSRPGKRPATPARPAHPPVSPITASSHARTPGQPALMTAREARQVPNASRAFPVVFGPQAAPPRAALAPAILLSTQPARR